MTSQPSFSGSGKESSDEAHSMSKLTCNLKKAFNHLVDRQYFQRNEKDQQDHQEVS